ncbi:hypothetical protein [Elizabethkingia anophelis]|uniref:hypothetical protein n=1 Tax=Elizabethkingia anophelis TaxID=1117645 RepID=UPI00389223C6
MAALIRGNVNYYSDVEKEQKVFEYVDKFIKNLPEFNYFSLNSILSEVEPDHKESLKVVSIIPEIRTVLEKLNFIEFAPGSNNRHILTEKGIEAKRIGGYFKYLESLKPKKDWYRIIPIILTFVFGTLTIVFTILNYNLNIKKDKSIQENQVLKKQNDSLRIIMSIKDKQPN